MAKCLTWPGHRHVLVSVLALCLPLGLMGHSYARNDEPSLESEIKATYLLKFPPFITWRQALPAGSFGLCVVGGDPFHGVLQQAAAGQSEDNHPVAVRMLAGAGNGNQCQEMFVAGGDAQSVASTLAAVRGAPVLTVTDGQTDPAARGIINFVLSDGRVRFEVDLAAATANGITVSSKLLSIAVAVHGSAR